VLNILRLILTGIWLAISYVFAAVLLTLTIIGIPFAKHALKLAHCALCLSGASSCRPVRGTKASA
jgi:uncharacterized membrane protein YccF (DUF307 family)